MKSKVVAVGIAVVLVAACFTSKAIADDRRGANSTKSAGELKLLVDQSPKSLPSLIESAVSRTNSKCASACMVEWRVVKQAVLENPNADMSRDEVSKFEPSHPVAHVVCVDNDNHVIESIVCSKTGKVIATRQEAQFGPGKGAFLASASSYSESGSDEDNWNRAPTGRWQKASDLLKKPVSSQETSERIGDVKDLVIDPDAGRIMYSIVEFSGKMGHGDRWYAVPLCVGKLSPDYKSVEMEYSTSQINNANGFDHDNWPNLADESYGNSVYKAYGRQPYWRGSEQRIIKASASDRRENDRDGTEVPRRWQKASDLIGKQVKNLANENLGSLKDIVVDADSGRILYGVLSFGGVLSLGDKLFAVPWSAMELSADYKSLTLAVDKERLKKADGFDRAHWPNMADERWASGIYDYYGQRRYWERNR